MHKSSIKANKIPYPSSFIQNIRPIKYKYTHDLYTKSAMDVMMQPTQQQNDDDGALEYEQLEVPVPEAVVTEPEPQQKKIPPDGRFTLALVFAILAVCIGSSFQFGYHIGNMNIPGKQIKKWLNQSHEQMFGHETSPEFIDTISEVALSVFAVGGCFGGISVGFIADKFGRKTTLICNNVLAVLAATLMVNAKTIGWYFVFIAGRFVIGLNSGLNSGLAPMYLMEISPANLRGTVGSCAQLFITIAILFGQILGLPALLGTTDNWPLIFGFAIVPVIVQLCTLPLCPESPKFNFMRGRKDQAEEDLKKLRQQDDVSAELEQLNEEAVLASSQADVTMKQMFGAELRWPLGLAVFMMVSQQLSGINAAMFYSSKIFERAQLPEFWSNIATLAMGTINVLMTVVSVYLVDRLGRRILLISGMVGMLFSTMMITSSMLIAQAWDWYSYMSILFVLLFVISFATGPGSIPWFYVSELFPSNARGNANTIAVFTNWLFTFFLGFYPKLDNVLPAYSFLFFAGCLLLSILFALKFLPETKNKTLEEIHEEMNRRRGIINEEIDV